jgi:hypothetical protein
MHEFLLLVKLKQEGYTYPTGCCKDAIQDTTLTVLKKMTFLASKSPSFQKWSIPYSDLWINSSIQKCVFSTRCVCQECKMWRMCAAITDKIRLIWCCLQMVHVKMYKFSQDWIIKQEVLERTDPPTVLTLFNKLSSLQRHGIAYNYRILHRVV